MAENSLRIRESAIIRGQLNIFSGRWCALCFDGTAPATLFIYRLLASPRGTTKATHLSVSKHEAPFAVINLPGCSIAGGTSGIWNYLIKSTLLLRSTTGWRVRHVSLLVRDKESVAKFESTAETLRRQVILSRHVWSFRLVDEFR